MKNIIYTLFLLTAVACVNKDIIKGTAVSFYPKIVDNVVEGGATSATLELTGPGTGTVTITVSDPEAVTTTPAMANGVISITFDGAESSKKIDIDVKRNNRPQDYIVTFDVTGVSGDIKDIATGQFKLAVTAIPALALPFIDDFESCTEDFATPEKWIEEFVGDVKTDRGWACRANDGLNGTRGVRASAFGGETGTENAWLITKGSLDLTAVSQAFMSFDMKSRYAGDGELFVWWSEDYSGAGDPSQATWAEVPGIQAQLPTPGSDSYRNISTELTNLIGKKVFFAFQYVGASNTSSASFEMDNFTISEDGTVSEFFNVPYTTDFNACSDFGIPFGFKHEIVPGAKQDRGWECSGNGTSGSQAVSVSALGGVAGTADAWLISKKPFDLTAITKGSLVFDAQSREAGSGTLAIKWSDNYSGTGDPTNATWTEFSGVSLPAGGSGSYQEVSVDIAPATGKAVYIAFQFTGGTNASSVSYDIDNFDLSENTGGGGGPPAGSTDPGNCNLTGTGTIIRSHDFEDCTDDFSTPAGFIEVVVAGSKTDRGWGCRADGTNNSRAVRASAFGGAAGTDNAWLVMDPFDASPYSEISLSFDVQSLFDGPGDLFVHYSTDYSGAGDPSSATWTRLENVDTQLPAKGSSQFVTVTTAPCNMSGTSVYIAFQYVGGTDSASSAWSIDNLELRGN